MSHERKVQKHEAKLSVSKTFLSIRVFPRPFTYGGGGGQVQGDKALWEGLMKGDIDLMGGANFDRLYHKLKVLLMLSCNYRMKFIGYNSIKTR